jgi:large subunit ribosomal protein L23
MALFGKKKKVEAEEVSEVKTKKVATKETKTAKAKTEKPAAKKTPKAKAAKTETKETEVKAVKAKKEEVVATGKSDYAYRITEKATRLADKNVYVLNVPKTINKTQLKFDLEKKYKVTVLDINISNTPKKDKMFRGHWGTRGGGKKAYITLKAGDSIVL